MFKKLVLFLILLLTLSQSGHAVSVNNFLVPCGPTGLCATTQYKDLGTDTSRLGTIYADNINISTALVLGGAVSGNLAMGGFNITNARNVYMDADSNSGFGSTADNVIDLFANGLSYIKFGINTMGFQGGSPTISTISNASLAIVPNGSGKVRIGDAYTTPLSLSTDNDSLLITKDIEIGDTIFTGGQTMATNRGDVPWITMTTTSASPAGTAHSLPILNNGFLMGNFYSEADGAGGLQNRELRVPALRSYGRIQAKQGTDIASATNIVIPTDGNVFELTGTTKVDLISNLGWQEGSEITLVCNESVTIDNGTATSGTNITIKLAGGSDLSCTAGDVLKLTLLSTTAGGQAWLEVSRSVN